MSGRKKQKFGDCPDFSYNYLERSLCLINTSTNGQVVNGRMLNNPFLVNNEQSSQCNPLKHWKTFRIAVKKSAKKVK